jgi:hypothetical protein
METRAQIDSNDITGSSSLTFHGWFLEATCYHIANRLPNCAHLKIPSKPFKLKLKTSRAQGTSTLGWVNF